jgi:hypothetical protein
MRSASSRKGIGLAHFCHIGGQPQHASLEIVFQPTHKIIGYAAGTVLNPPGVLNNFVQHSRDRGPLATKIVKVFGHENRMIGVLP